MLHDELQPPPGHLGFTCSDQQARRAAILQNSAPPQEEPELWAVMHGGIKEYTWTQESVWDSFAHLDAQQGSTATLIYRGA